MRAVWSRDAVAIMVPSGDHATYHTPPLCPVSTEKKPFVTGTAGTLIRGAQVLKVCAHPHAIPPDDRAQGQSRVTAVVVTFPGSKCSCTKEGAIRILSGKNTNALEEESNWQSVGVPAEGMGPIFAVQLKFFPGRMKLIPITVIESPVKGDTGCTLTAVGTVTFVQAVWPDAL